MSSSSDSSYSTYDKIYELLNFEFFEMIDECVTFLEDYFEITDLKTKSQFSYNLLGKIGEDNAYILFNISERFSKIDNSLKLSLSFFYSVYCVNVEYTVQKCLKVFHGMRKGVKRIFLMAERLLRLGMIFSARSSSA